MSMKHTMQASSITVTEALGRLELSQDLKKYIKERQATWEVFGKMNSHMYRARLMKMMAAAGLDPQSQFMVFFMFSVIKSQKRVLEAMDVMDPVDMQQPWFAKVRGFISTQVTQYVSDVNRNKKFPAVNIPTCNPGLDVLIYCMITPPDNRSFYDLTVRPTFSQLKLSDSVQVDAKEGVKEYWNNVVTGTKNPDAKTMSLPAPEYREEFYANSAKDEYLLVSEDLVEIPPEAPFTHYAHEDIFEYMITVSQVEDFSFLTSGLMKEMEAIYGLDVSNWPKKLVPFFNKLSLRDMEEFEKDPPTGELKMTVDKRNADVEALTASVDSASSSKKEGKKAAK